MIDIFLSYAREDTFIAQKLAMALEDEGWLVWWDKHIPAGKTFYAVIEEKVAAARCVVVLWSKNSVDSRWVNIEAHAGSTRGILVPAALITNMETLPLAFRFEQTASLVGWKGEKSHQGYQSIIDAISALAGPPRPVKACGESKPQRRPELQPHRRHPQAESKPRSSAFPTPKWKIADSAPALARKWPIAVAASAMVAGIIVLALINSPTLPVPPVYPAHRAKVVIQDYGEHYQLYRGGELLGRTPFEFYANIGERVDLDCRTNNKHVQTLTFVVSTNNVWACRK